MGRSRNILLPASHSTLPSHNQDFTGIGVAVPARINMYRIQALRAVGANFFRTSHNPYSTPVYELGDRLGITFWDEARDYDLWNTEDMHDMVRRDRSYASVIIYSFCNEIE